MADSELLTYELLVHISRRKQLPLLPTGAAPPATELGDVASLIRRGLAVAKPVLLPDPANVQGDVYLTFPKDWEKLLFFHITNPKLFVKDLAKFKPTTSADVIHDSLLRIAKFKKAARARTKPEDLSQKQIAFTRKGMDLLGHKEHIGDNYFDDGISNDTPTANVDYPFRPSDQEIHGVFTIAASDEANCKKGKDSVLELFKNSITVAELEGHSRPARERGHEHFGFLDGVSQPALRGLILPQKGQPQCNAGVVIMGYPGDPLYEAGSAEARPAWTRDGSLMVFRKLKQMVPEFRRYVKDAGPKWREWMPSEEVEDMKKLNPPFADAEGEDLYGARLVGRWKSGAPIPRALYRDDLTQTTEDTINDFDFTVQGASNPTQLRTCPFTGHIRKVLPRNLDPFVQRDFLESRFIVRSGMPYGPEVDESSESQTTKSDRGLLFACYQSSIGNGFQSQLSWIWNDYFPPASFRPSKWGQDAILGITPPPPTVVQVTAGQKLPKDGEISLEVENNPPDANAAVVDGFSQAKVKPSVTPSFHIEFRGGDYFFVPSVKTLRQWSSA